MKKSSSTLIYISLIFILFFDLWVENSEQATSFYGYWIEPFIDKPKFSVVWTVLICIALFVAFNNKLRTKEQEKDELEKTLDSEMGILIMANKGLNRYRLQDNMMEILNRFVQQNPYVSAAQWYNYIENNHQGKTRFKFNFQYGYVMEDVNLNAVQQLYYHCNTSALRKFRKAKEMYREKGNPDLLVDFVIDIYKEVGAKKEEQLTQEDAVLCSLMLLTIEVLEKDYGLVFEDFSGSETDKYQKLVDNNRTGILRATLMGDEYYSFTHTRSNEKINRQYIARLVKVQNENVVFTIVLDPSILEEKEYEEIMLTIANEFKMLLIELESMYNRGSEGVGD